MNQIQQEKVNVQSFQAKYKSKRECYNFLAVDVGVYLPAYETVTIYFLKDIISGTKKCKYRFNMLSKTYSRIFVIINKII